MDLATELHVLVHVMDQQTAAILRPFDMTLHKHTLLSALDSAPGMTGRELAEVLGISGAATSGLVKHLVGQGLVEDRASFGSGNRQALHLTDAGQDLLGHTTRALGSSFDDVARAAGQDPQDLARSLHAITDLLITDPKD